MVARLTGASLGLLAFAVTVLAGLMVNNPVVVTLSRGILAMFLFCFLGLCLGAVAELVVREYERDRQSEIRERCRVQSEALKDGAEDGGRKADEGLSAEA